MATRKQLVESVKSAYQTIYMEYWLRLSERYLEGLIDLLPDDKIDEAYDRLLYHHKQITKIQGRG